MNSYLELVPSRPGQEPVPNLQPPRLLYPTGRETERSGDVVVSLYLELLPFCGLGKARDDLAEATVLGGDK